jgi:hypothetical protein
MAGTDKARLRVERFLSKGAASLVASAKPGECLLDGGDRGSIALEAAVLDGMAREGLLRVEAGRVALARGLGAAPESPRRLESRTIAVEGKAEIVLVNAAESPLAQLARIRTREGKCFLAPAEFDAGERFRADYTRGQIMPRLGATWVASVSSGRRDGGIADLTETALAARMRVEKAIEAVGPELSGVLVDVCCFLKGLSTVESERGWPVRSAKLMLKSALGALARHYQPPRPQGPRRSFHWGSADYRPTLEPASG